MTVRCLFVLLTALQVMLWGIIIYLAIGSELRPPWIL